MIWNTHIWKSLHCTCCSDKEKQDRHSFNGNRSYLRLGCYRYVFHNYGCGHHQCFSFSNLSVKVVTSQKEDNLIAVNSWLSFTGLVISDFLFNKDLKRGLTLNIAKNYVHCQLHIKIRGLLRNGISVIKYRHLLKRYLSSPFLLAQSQPILSSYWF